MFTQLSSSTHQVLIVKISWKLNFEFNKNKNKNHIFPQHSGPNRALAATAFPRFHSRPSGVPDGELGGLPAFADIRFGATRTVTDMSQGGARTVAGSHQGHIRFLFTRRLI